VALGAGRLSDGLGGDRGRRIQVGLDQVDAVAVGADRRLPVSSFERLAVHAGDELSRLLRVTLAAGRRHVEFEDRGFRILAAADVVRVVAIGADCRLLRALGDRPPMHALLVVEEGVHVVSRRLHHELDPVAAAAGLRERQTIDRRRGIRARHDRVGVAVTAHAGRRPASRRLLARLGMDSAGVGGDRIVMATGALRRRELVGMRKVLRLREIGMAVHAREPRLTVDGSREPVLRNEHGRATGTPGRRILVAGEAVLVGGRRRRFLGQRRQGSGREAEQDRSRNELQPALLS
jgi:hypothetical protein